MTAKTRHLHLCGRRPLLLLSPDDAQARSLITGGRYQRFPYGRFEMALHFAEEICGPAWRDSRPRCRKKSSTRTALRAGEHVLADRLRTPSAIVSSSRWWSMRDGSMVLLTTVRPTCARRVIRRISKPSKYGWIGSMPIRPWTSRICSVTRSPRPPHRRRIRHSRHDRKNGAPRRPPALHFGDWSTRRCSSAACV